VTLPEFYAYAAPVGKTLRCPEAKLPRYATKVFCPPWYWNRGPGWLSSQGVLQSDETKI